MKTSVEEAEGPIRVTILRVDGDIDSSTYEALIEEGRRLRDDGARDVLLDLRSVPYMGSSGLVAIHAIALLFNGGDAPATDSGWEAHHAIARSVDDGLQPHVKVLLPADPASPLRRVFERTGMNRFIDVRDDEADALAAF